MRISIPSVITGTLGAIVQRLIGGVNALVSTQWPYAYGAAFASTTALAALATEQVFSAASNPNGAIVWDCDIDTLATGASSTCISLHAKATAPAAFTDLDVLLSVMNDMVSAVGQGMTHGSLRDAVAVPAGRGLFFLNSGGSTESASRRRLVYTLL